MSIFLITTFIWILYKHFSFNKSTTNEIEFIILFKNEINGKLCLERIKKNKIFIKIQIKNTEMYYKNNKMYYKNFDDKNYLETVNDKSYSLDFL